MTLPRITAAVGIFDRTQPLLDGRVGVSGFDVQWTSGELESLFSRAFATAEFDVTELSFCNYLIAATRGDCPYVALPIFPTRCFRHHAIFVRKGSGITSPRELEGRTVGLREYTNTASLVARGALAGYYGVDLTRIRWVVGDVDAKEREPADIRIPQVKDTAIVSAGATLLSDLVAAGELDGVISYTPPRGLREGVLVRLFDRWWEEEARYYADTGIFPVMHVIAVRRTLLERHPELASALTSAFEAARDLALRDLEIEQAPRTMLPWAPAHLHETRLLMGTDFWAYGLTERNRTTVEAQIEWAFRQGLIPRPLPLSEFFA